MVGHIMTFLKIAFQVERFTLENVPVVGNSYGIQIGTKCQKVILMKKSMTMGKKAFVGLVMVMIYSNIMI